MNAEQFQAGRDRIDRAISAAITNKTAQIGFELRGGSLLPGVKFTATIGSNTAQVLFSHEEVTDSHEQLTPEASFKVRQLADEVASFPIMSGSLPGGPTQKDRR